MSDSSALHTMQTNPAHQHLESLNFEIKKLNTAHDILETLKKQCIAFQSFPDLQTECFKSSSESDAINEALNLFLRELTQALGCMILNTPNSKVRNKDCFLMENIKLLEEKILKDPQTFQETCRIYYNIQNLTEISMKYEPKNSPQNGKKQRQNQKKNTQKLLKAKIKKTKSKTSAKKTSKTRKNANSEPEKVLLRLLPHSTETHQIMMKLENFPRLELKVSPNNFLRNINEHLTHKWLASCSQSYHIDYYPDESKWLKNVNIQNPKSVNPTSLSENYMINDIFSAYNCPQNKVVYIFYELKEKVSFLKKNVKKEYINVEKPATISTTPNNSKETSEENYIFAQNLLKNMDLLKHNNDENMMESKNIKDVSCTNFLNMNDSPNNEAKNSQIFNLKPMKRENSVLSINETKKSVNFTNFSGSLNFLKAENSEPIPQKNVRQIDFNKNKKREEGTRKDVRHFNKIKDLVDIVGKKYEKLQKK